MPLAVCIVLHYQVCDVDNLFINILAYQCTSTQELNRYIKKDPNYGLLKESLFMTFKLMTFKRYLKTRLIT